MQRRAASLVVPLLLVLLLASCGGGGTKAVASGSTTTTAAPAAGAGFQAYRDCLQQHGVKLPAGGGQRPGGTATPGARTRPPGGGQRTPGSLPPGVDQKTFQAAQDACASKRPAGGFGGGGAAGSTAFKAYTSCLADHGVTVTSTPSSGGAPGGGGIDRSDPDFAKANQTCAALLPQGGPTTTAG